MANKAAAKKTKKEQEAENKSRWMKIILAAILVLIMIIVPLATLLNPTSLHNISSGDTDNTNAFDSIVDALKDLPPNANYVRYVDLNTSSAVTGWAMGNIGYNLPNASIFGVTAKKDALACFPYPTLSQTIVDNGQQVIVLSDLGQGYDNASYPKATYDGYELRIVQDPYGFSTDSYPVISGRKEYVAVMDNYMHSSHTSSAYSTYSGLLEQAGQSAQNATLAVVGTTDSLGFGDLYYAGITPLNDTMCDYNIVIHLNQTLNQTQMADISGQWQTGASLYGIEVLAPQFKADYMIMSAKGDIDACLYDMAKNLEFLKG